MNNWLKVWEKVFNWNDWMKLVAKSIDIDINLGSIKELFEWLSNWTKVWSINRDSDESRSVREAVESIF